MKVQVCQTTNELDAVPTLTLLERKIVRLAAPGCLSASQPIAVEHGTAAPYWTGRGFYYTTPGGKEIAHPGAYRWPKVYHASTWTLHVGVDWIRTKRTPRGMVWQCDANGPYLQRLTDGMDYHPSKFDFMKPAFARCVRRAMAVNYRSRVEARKAARVLARALPTICVTLHDSRRAGNCVAGTAAWIERCLGLAANQVIAAGYLAHVPASRVLAAATGTANQLRVEAAVRMAEQRLTLVQI